MRRLTKAILAAVLACALLTPTAWAGAGRPHLAPLPGAQFPKRLFALTLPAGRDVTRGQVSLTENGSQVSHLSATAAKAVGEKDFGVVVVLDESNSMRGRPIKDALAAARTFAAKRNPQQKLAVVTFNRRTVVALPPTTDSAAITSALAATPSLGGGTHLYDAVTTALSLLREAKIRAGSIVLLSDGSDTGSHASTQDAAAAARAVGARIFTVGLRSRTFDSAALKGLAVAGHGDYSEARSSADLAPIYAALGSRLSHEYLIQYQSLASLGAAVHVELRAAGIPTPVTADYAAPPAQSKHGVATGRPAGLWASRVTMIVVSIICALLIGLMVAMLLDRRVPRTTLVTRLQRFVSSAPATEKKIATPTLTGRALVEAERSLELTSWWPTFKEELDIAKVEIPPINVVCFTAVATVAVMWLLLAASGNALVALLGLSIPFVVRAVIKHKLDAQRKLFDDQLADNLRVIAAAMRAGHSFVAALALAVEDSAEPARSEFRRVIADEKLGVPLESALGVTARRMQSDDLDQAVLVASLQRETGGNMAEVIDQVAETIRERAELRQVVRTLTAQGRMSRWIVTALPVALLLIITLINPDYMKPLYVTSTGHVLLVFAGFLLVAGSLVIKRIVNIKV